MMSFEEQISILQSTYDDVNSNYQSSIDSLSKIKDDISGLKRQIRAIVIDELHANDLLDLIYAANRYNTGLMSVRSDIEELISQRVKKRFTRVIYKFYKHNY